MNNTESIVKLEEDKVTFIGEVVCDGFLNLRSQPSLEGAVLRRLIPGTKVECKNESSNWYRVWAADGLEGFCLKDYVFILSAVSKED
jgi:uncharacterized protein YgiM (DUF1202 family)